MIKLQEDLWDYIKSKKEIIDKRIDQWVQELNLRDPHVNYVVKGGKRLRSILTLLVGEALGYETKELLDFATAIELIHNATLIHDDIIDKHTTRRGKESLWRLSGLHNAVILGDLLFSLAGYKLKEISYEALGVVTEGIYRVSLGVYLEANPLAGIEMGYRIYEMINKLKTAELFGAAAKLGAILMHDRHIADSAYNFGIAVGEAYQLADDLVDINNFLQGDKTVDLKPLKLLIVYLKKDIKLLEELFVSEGNFDIVNDQLREIDALNVVTELIKEKVNSAKTFLEIFPKNKYTDLLGEIPQKMIDAMLKEQVKPPE